MCKGRRKRTPDHTSSRRGDFLSCVSKRKRLWCLRRRHDPLPLKECDGFHMVVARTQWPIREFKEWSKTSVNLLLLKVSCFLIFFEALRLIGFPLIVTGFLSHLISSTLWYTLRGTQYGWFWTWSMSEWKFSVWSFRSGATHWIAGYIFSKDCVCSWPKTFVKLF